MIASSILHEIAEQRHRDLLSAAAKQRLVTASRGRGPAGHWRPSLAWGSARLLRRTAGATS